MATLSIVLNIASIARDTGNSLTTLDQVLSLMSTTTEQLFHLDSFLYEGRPCRWLGIGPESNCHIPTASGRCLLLRKNERVYAQDDEFSGMQCTMASRWLAIWSRYVLVAC